MTSLLAAYALAVLLTCAFRWISSEDAKAQRRRTPLGLRPRSEPLYDTASFVGGARTRHTNTFTNFKPFDRALGGGVPASRHHYWYGLRPGRPS